MTGPTGDKRTQLDQLRANGTLHVLTRKSLSAVLFRVEREKLQVEVKPERRGGWRLTLKGPA